MQEDAYRLKRSSTGTNGYSIDDMRTSENAFDVSSEVCYCICVVFVVSLLCLCSVSVLRVGSGLTWMHTGRHATEEEML